MTKCPICETKYTENQVETCTVCGYDLTPYPFVLGEIPSGFIEKEKKRIAAAKRVWQLSQSRLRSAKVIISKFQSHLDRITQQINHLTELTESQHQHHADFQFQLDSIVEKIHRLNTEPHQQQLLNLPQLDEIPGTISGLIEATEVVEMKPQQGEGKYIFDIVTVNERGEETSRSQAQAECMVEDLGNGVILEMVIIPGGTFIMGSPPSEQRWDGYDGREEPQHPVTIQPFLMGKYPVTQAQWRQVASFPKLQRDLDPDPSHFKGLNLPVDCVSWYDAIEWCVRLSKRIGKHYRLPSEAEWEYAARAGTTTPFHIGETLTTDLANYDGNWTYASGFKGVYPKKTTPVGQFQHANAFGLYDIHGNVCEWCADPWHSNYMGGAPSNGRVWNGLHIYVENLVNLLECRDKRVVRGGSWYSFPGYCRCAYRDCIDPADSSYGFRVCCSLPETLRP